VRFETFVAERDEKRKNAKICQTKYPLLLVHGVFFRDYDHLNYWGRIPKELETNGAVIFYGGHNSASAVKDSGRELEVKIKQVLQETGCEKVNIIAHSKGGLDSRALIAANPSLVASLTTINTPHRGCEFADYFFHKLPEAQKQALAARYNALATKLGDVNPDFIAAVYDLTSTACAKFNEEVKDHPDVMYQSYGSVLRKARSGKFPLNLTYNMVRHFDGENDGLVGTDSFPWGESSTLLRNEVTKRGISHGDVIDLNRENIDGFDVREFYVQLVHNLKERGF
jgi:triacylglycerol lipase